MKQIKCESTLFMSTLIFLSPYLYSSLYEFFISGPELCQGGRCRVDRILDETAESDSCQLWRNKNVSLHFHVDSHFFPPYLYHHCTSFSFQDLSFVKEVDTGPIEFWMQWEPRILVSCGEIKMRVYIFMSKHEGVPAVSMHPYVSFEVNV